MSECSDDLKRGMNFAAGMIAGQIAKQRDAANYSAETLAALESVTNFAIELANTPIADIGRLFDPGKASDKVS